MIVFDLRCAAGHVFEAWFASSAAYAEQCGGGLIACPICGDTGVAKAVTEIGLLCRINETGSGRNQNPALLYIRRRM